MKNSKFGHRNFPNESLGQKIYSFVSGGPGDENKSHAGGRRNIFFEHFKKIRILENCEFYFS